MQNSQRPALHMRVSLVPRGPDDHRMLRVMLCGWREDDEPSHDSFEVTSAASAGEALERFTRAMLDDCSGNLPFDVVVCDARSHPVDALDAVERLRRCDRLLPILCLVARLDGVTAEMARDFGASRVIRAPFGPQDVRDQVLSLVADGSRRAT